LREFRDRVEDYGRRHPCVGAYEALRDGEQTDRVIGRQSVELWEQIVEADPDEGLALHHLAIIHHGAGFHLHGTAPDKSAAVEQWRRGLEAWKRLLDADSFWEGLRERWRERVEASDGADMLAQRLLTKVDLQAFRRQIPRHLLGVHVAIVQDCFSTDPELAGRHLDLIRNGPFAGPDADRLCGNLYRTFTSDLDSLRAERRFAEARQRLETFLKIDPDNERALMDLLRTATAEVERMEADGRPLPERKRRMESAVFAADRLRATGAVEQFAAAGAVRDFFCAFAWMFIQAARDLPDLHGVQKPPLYEQGLQPARRALEVERAGDQARIVASIVCVEGSMVDFNFGMGSLDVARRLTEEGLKLIPDHPAVHALQAAIHLRDLQFDKMRESLREAERLNRVQADPAATSLIPQLRGVARDPAAARLQECLNRANEAIQRRDYRGALRVLDEADSPGSDAPDVPAMKAGCYCRLLEFGEAEKAYREAKRRAGAKPSPGVEAMLKQVEALLRESKPGR